MKELQISEDEANNLIFLLKRVIEEHNGELNEGSVGEIYIIGSGDYTFTLNYRFSRRKTSFNLRENKYNYNLLRINLNNGFHKNANGEKVFGNRINVFSTEEYILKKDGTTYMRAFPLPYESIENTDDFFEALENLLSYTNTNNTDKIKVQDTLL